VVRFHWITRAGALSSAFPFVAPLYSPFLKIPFGVFDTSSEPPWSLRGIFVAEMPVGIPWSALAVILLTV